MERQLFREMPVTSDPAEATVGRKSAPLSKSDVSEMRVSAALVAAEDELRGFVRMLVGDPDLADEIHQETCLVIWRRRTDYRPDRPFAPWARGIARRVVQAAWRKRYRRGDEPLDERTLELLERSWTARPEEPDRRLVALDACLGLLREEERTVLGRLYGERTPLAALSEEIGRSVEALKQLAYRLRRKLEDCVNRRLDGERSDG